MTTDPTGEWLAALGTLTAAGMTAEDARVRITAYAALLRTKFPTSAFTAESLEAVAAESKFFPSYGEVVERLTAYWRDRHPPQPALGSAAVPPGAWAKSVAARLANGADRAQLLSLVRTYAPPDEVRALMAQHWPKELRAEEDHAAEVRRDKARKAEEAARALAATLRSADAPKAQRPASSAPPPPDEPPPPPERHLKPAHLAAERAKAAAAIGMPPKRAPQPEPAR